MARPTRAPLNYGTQLAQIANISRVASVDPGLSKVEITKLNDLSLQLTALLYQAQTRPLEQARKK